MHSRALSFSKTPVEWRLTLKIHTTGKIVLPRALTSHLRTGLTHEAPTICSTSVIMLTRHCAFIGERR